MTAKLRVNKLNFYLPEGVMNSYCQVMEKNTEKVLKLTQSSGTGSDKFKQAYQRFISVLRQHGDIEQALNEPVDLRALAIVLKTNNAFNIKLCENLFRKIDYIKPRPSSLLLEAIYSYYLKKYDKLSDLKSVEAWLRKSKEARGELDQNIGQILGGEGPKWLAESCHIQQIDFNACIERVGLNNYLSGRFLENAKNIYYLETLRQLEPGENHELLIEIQKKEVFESRYSEESLLGHEVLRILISKADSRQISDHWMNVIMAIAGDPRVSTRNERYIRWWSQISQNLIAKVRGWLSKLDLRLFLEALKDFSTHPGKEELKRMYPSRKRFLEGLLQQELVMDTRLFLTYEAERYIQKHYKMEHLPAYSIVDGGSPKPLVYIYLNDAHVIEGTHSCYFWVYERLAKSAAVFNYNKRKFTYRELTVGLNERMLVEQNKGCYAAIQHNGSWQMKAAIALKELGVDIDASMLLTKSDYQHYKFSGHL
ncbi:hypothetical protein K1Y77_01125 [Halomonas qaidamensis]|uniref:Zorya protein ZorC EH domain-containing protein n=1 Tax=Halomonas qaidamensis TaxID=2866211 RepID=A0ABY6JPU9_9GAMM|nr:EH signature domain-containing protein [Halomonas qaidamensis]UYV19321.1 hypothetical protein K1Y77_01125 [Halomonas qaidamensis]